MPEVHTKLVKFPKSEDMVELIIMDCPSLESYTDFLPKCVSYHERVLFFIIIVLWYCGASSIIYFG